MLILSNQLEDVVGGDLDVKVKVIACLKRYAEDRDVYVLCDTLNDLLHTRQHRSIFRQLR